MVSHRSNSGGIVGGTILLGLGLLFLLGQFAGLAAWARLWPLVIIGVSAAFFVGMLVGGKSAAPLAIPGTLLGAIGLMLLVQSLTGQWESWAYAWTIIIMAVGVGLFLAGVWAGNERQRQAGLRVAGIGFVFFVIFGAFFELLLAGWGGARIQQMVFPALLILLGLFLIFRHAGWWPQPTQPAPPSFANRAAGEQNPPPPVAPQS